MRIRKPGERGACPRLMGWMEGNGPDGHEGKGNIRNGKGGWRRGWRSGVHQEEIERGVEAMREVDGWRLPMGSKKRTHHPSLHEKDNHAGWVPIPTTKDATPWDGVHPHPPSRFQGERAGTYRCIHEGVQTAGHRTNRMASHPRRSTPLDAWIARDTHPPSSYS
eukprot:scaffold574_cov333-Pavlova_lutheri.AAC.26